ncbi:MAG: hypothetical protein AAF736_02230 [Pseudomonadota bacterium]
MKTITRRNARGFLPALALSLLSAGGLAAAQDNTPAAVSADDTAASSSPMKSAPANPDQGHIYGTVLLDDDSEVTGTIRWGEQEANWIHHFNGDKAEPFDLSQLPDDDRERIEDSLPGPRFEFNGHVIELVRWLGSSDLQAQSFSVEFGQLSQLETLGGDRVRLTLRDGTTLEANGGSDDIGADIEVLGASGQVQQIDWRDIEQVRFHAPEATAPTFSPYLYGRVETRSGAFEGFVDWDRDERYPEDELDGDVDGREQAVKFSTIRTITNQGESSLVELVDGVTQSMSDTNDVNSENRGIVVHAAGLGRVLVPWSAFEKVSFFNAPDNLPRYAEFSDAGPIKARVSGAEGTAEGELMFDLDQGHEGEMLRGKDASGLQFELPWQYIQRVTPQENNTATVTLRSGQVLELGKDPDVTGSNLGIAVVQKDRVQYVPWEGLNGIEVQN